MSFLNKISFLILAYQLAIAQCSCPHINPAENFNLEKFATGIWYDVAIPHNHLANGEIFASLMYTKNGDNITFKSVGIPRDDINYIEGSCEPLSFGKFLYTYIIGKPKDYVHTLVTIAAIDDDFLSLYGCKDDDEYEEIAWVSSRVEHPVGALKEKIQNYLDNYKSPVTNQSVIWMTRF